MSVSKLQFKDSAYLDTAFPASERIYVQGRIYPSVRVPLREVSLKDDSRQRVYDTRGPWADPGQTCNPRSGIPALHDHGEEEAADRSGDPDCRVGLQCGSSPLEVRRPSVAADR